MAEAEAFRKPTAVTEEVDLSVMKVKMLVDGIIPVPFGNKKKAKNGEVDVTFLNFGFDLLATVRKSNGEEVKWRYAVKKLPSEIVINKSTFKVEKGMITLTIHKKKEVSWVSMLRRGLEQADSDDSSEEEKDGGADAKMVHLQDKEDTHT